MNRLLVLEHAVPNRRAGIASRYVASWAVVFVDLKRASGNRGRRDHMFMTACVRHAASDVVVCDSNGDVAVHA